MKNRQNSNGIIYGITSSNKKIRGKTQFSSKNEITPKANFKSILEYRDGKFNKKNQNKKTFLLKI